MELITKTISLTELPSCFRLAKAISVESDHPKYQCGAAIFKKGNIIAIGRNYFTKTHPILIEYDDSGYYRQHAEVSCILKIKNKEVLIGATIVIFRSNRHGVPSMAKPCEMCLSIIKNYGFKKMIYTTYGGWAEEYL